MILSLSEILQKTGSLKSKQEKIDFLKKHNSEPLRSLLNYIYNKNIKILLPDTPPPWNKNKYVDVEGRLYHEVRRLRIFVEGGGYDNLNQTKREYLFISLLEQIDDNDAQFLVDHFVCRKKIPGITKSLVKETFPELELE